MKKNFHFLTFLAVAALSSVTACKTEKTGDPKGILLSSNVTEINKRLTTYENEVVPLVEYGGQRVSAAKGNNQISSVDISSNYNLRLVAEVQAPVYNGSTLQATEVTVSGNRAYVSYNTQGSVYLGGIDVIDITDGSKPKLLQSAVTPNIDISSLAFDNNYLYIAGALDIDQFSDYSYPAIASRIGIESGLLTENITNVKLGGYVANSIAIDGNSLFVTSGNTNGGVSIIDKANLTIKSTLALDGAKDVAVGMSDYTVLFGAFIGSPKQTLAVYDKATNQLKSSSDVPAGIDPQAKSNIAIARNSVLLSNGKAGITFWNPVTNVRLDHIGLPASIDDTETEDIYTNSVSVSDNYVYGANGAAGLVVSRINTTGDGLEILGIADSKGSANYVKAAKDLIFVASGKDGVQIYKLESKIVPPPVSTTPACESRPVLNSNNHGTYNNNSGAKEYFRGSTVLGGLNVNDVFDYCGSLSILSTVNVNSNASLNVSGSLSIGDSFNINKTAKLTGNLVVKNLILNSNGEFEMLQSGALKVNGNMTMNSGSVLKVRGSLEIDGDFTFNGGRIEFIGTGNSVKIQGKVYGSGNSIVGEYTGKIK
ncbi:hypothetical protein GZH53_14620 [Flavihumibacter sp. R14]|nr:hypothetical protein [Flavihumibacter soli]